MRRIATILAAVIFAAAALSAQPYIDLKPNEVLLLYPEGQNSPNGMGIGPVESNGLTGPEKMSRGGGITNTGDSARVELYFPAKPNGQMVVVCPGGGYGALSSYNEGLYAAEWLLDHGIAAAVVEYRMPNGHKRIPLTDIQNVFRFCRANAQKWGVKQIGVMGFSAGGHLAASVSTLFVDDVTRPDFSILFYPVISFKYQTHEGTRDNLLGKAETFSDNNFYQAMLTKYSINEQVTGNTPPAFIVQSADDGTVPMSNAISYYQALTAMKVPGELHIYPYGGHGWGFTKQEYRGGGTDPFAYARDDFYAAMASWLKKLEK